MRLLSTYGVIFLTLIIGCGKQISSTETEVVNISQVTSPNGNQVTTTSSFSNGQIIDGDGRAQAYVNSRLDYFQKFLPRMQAKVPATLAAISACPAYDSKTCDDLKNFTSAERLTASQFAVKGAMLAPSLLPSLKIALYSGPPTAADDHGTYLVNARNNPDVDNQIDVRFDGVLEAMADPAKAVRLDHDLLHEIWHRLVSSQFGSRVTDTGRFAGIVGRRLIDRAVADLIIQSLYETPAPTCSIVAERTAFHTYLDIDGQPITKEWKVGFKVQARATNKPIISRINMVALTAIPAGETNEPHLTVREFLGTLSPQTGAEISATVTDDLTGQTANCRVSFSVTLQPVPMVTIHRFSVIGNSLQILYSHVATPPSNYRYDGPAFHVPVMSTPLCSRALLLDRGAGGSPVGRINLTLGDFLGGYGCQSVPTVGTRVLHNFSRSPGLWLATADPNEINLLRADPYWSYAGEIISVFK